MRTLKYLFLGLVALAIASCAIKSVPTTLLAPLSAASVPIARQTKGTLTLQIHWPYRPRAGFRVSSIPVETNTLDILVRKDGQLLSEKRLLRDESNLQTTATLSLDQASNLTVEILAYQETNPDATSVPLARGIATGVNLQPSQTTRLAITLDSLQTPAITRTDYNAARWGDTITLFGQNFGVPGDPVVVKFYSSASESITATQVTRNPDGSLAVQVPQNVTNGKITVTVDNVESTSDNFFWSIYRLDLTASLYPGDTTDLRTIHPGTSRTLYASCTYYPSSSGGDQPPAVGFYATAPFADAMSAPLQLNFGNYYVNEQATFSAPYVSQGATSSLYAQVGTVQSSPMAISVPSWIEDGFGIQPGQARSLPASGSLYVQGLAVSDAVTTLTNQAPEAVVAFVNDQDRSPWLQASIQDGSVVATAWRTQSAPGLPPAIARRIEAEGALRTRPVHLRDTASPLGYVPPVEGATLSMMLSPDVTKPDILTKVATIRKVDSATIGSQTINFVLVVDNDDLNTVTQDWIDSFDNEIKTVALPDDTTVVGPPPPGDAQYLSLHGDGNVYFFFTHELLNAGGYFGANDLLDGATSNHKAMLVLNSNSDKNYLYTTIVHEYGHLVYFWARVHAIDDVGLFEKFYDGNFESWFTEGVSVFLENYCGFGPEASTPYSDTALWVSQFLVAPQQFHLFPFAYDSTNAGNYGLSYLFVQYLTDRFGVGVIQEIVDSPRNATYNAAVSDVLLQHGTTFDDFMKDFATTLVLDGTPYESDRYHVSNIDLRKSYTTPVAAALNGPAYLNASSPTLSENPAQPWGLGFLRLGASASVTLSTGAGDALNGTVLVAPGSL